MRGCVARDLQYRRPCPGPVASSSGTACTHSVCLPAGADAGRGGSSWHGRDGVEGAAGVRDGGMSCEGALGSRRGLTQGVWWSVYLFIARVHFACKTSTRRLPWTLPTRDPPRHQTRTFDLRLTRIYLQSSPLAARRSPAWRTTRRWRRSVKVR
jgi:hypothetical protein